jgi:hypothetical protein
MLSIVLAFSSRVAKGFVHKNSGFAASRLLSIKGGANSMPSNDDMKPFYALGINIANQIGGELKVSLTKEELQIVVDGFTDSMRDAVEDDRTLLMTYGPKINEILNSRVKLQIDAEKKKGSEFATKYLLGITTIINIIISSSMSSFHYRYYHLITILSPSYHHLIIILSSSYHHHHVIIIIFVIRSSKSY